MVCTNVSDVVKEQKKITLIQKNDIKIVLIKQKSIYVKNSTIYVKNSTIELSRSLCLVYYYTIINNETT